jgi:hypothetical protein
MDQHVNPIIGKVPIYCGGINYETSWIMQNFFYLLKRIELPLLLHSFTTLKKFIVAARKSLSRLAAER